MTVKLQDQNRSDTSMITSELIEDLRGIINKTRSIVASLVNSSLTTLYWRIGHPVRQEILREERAEYGRSIVASLMRQLSWTHLNLKKIIKK